MQKNIALQLVTTAKQVAENFSNTDRSYYTSGGKHETFEYDEAKPLSENTAAVYLKKNTGKRALLFFYYVKNYGVDESGNPLGKWFYFFPTDSHLLGMREVEKYKQKLEEENFPKNFEEART